MDSDIRMVEMATGHVSNRHQVVETKNVEQYLFKPEDKPEVYHSWYVIEDQ